MPTNEVKTFSQESQLLSDEVFDCTLLCFFYVSPVDIVADELCVVTDWLRLRWVVHRSRHVRLGRILDVSLGDDLISVKAHVLAVSFILTRRPLTSLDGLHPAFKGNAAIGRLVNLSLL